MNCMLHSAIHLILLSQPRNTCFAASSIPKLLQYSVNKLPSALFNARLCQTIRVSSCCFMVSISRIPVPQCVLVRFLSALWRKGTKDKHYIYSLAAFNRKILVTRGRCDNGLWCFQQPINPL